MRKFRLFAFLIALSVIAGCIRRPFGEFNTEIFIKVELDMDLKHELVKVEKPEMMTVILCDPKSGEPMYTNHIPADGGYIYPEPGTYNILIYNFGTESTLIKNPNNAYTIEATTGDIPAFVKSQLAPFLSLRQKAKEEALKKQQEQEILEQRTIPETKQDTKQDTKAPEERIVNEPDHLFVGQKENVIIPQLEKGESKQITVQISAQTIVDTWHVKFTNVKGTKYISSTSALMNNLIESTILWNRKDMGGPVTVYFEMGVGKDKNSLFGTFHTFGRYPANNSGLNIDIGIMNIEGHNQLYQYDVSDQFVESNKDHLIVINDEIIIKEPVQTGGFKPEVDDWEDVETDIII